MTITFYHLITKGDISIDHLSHCTARSAEHLWNPRHASKLSSTSKRVCPPCLVGTALSESSPASFSGGHYIIVKGRRHSSSCLSSKVALVRPQPVLDPESLPLHDVPKLAQIWLGNDIVRFELECTQVVGLGFGEFTIEVKDGAEVHQSGRVLGEGRGTARTRSKQQKKIILFNLCECIILWLN